MCTLKILVFAWQKRPANDKSHILGILFAFVISTLDYDNSLLYGIPKRKINKLQLLENTAAMVVNAEKSDRRCMTAVRNPIYWLSVEVRIEFRV